MRKTALLAIVTLSACQPHPVPTAEALQDARVELQAAVPVETHYSRERLARLREAYDTAAAQEQALLERTYGLPHRTVRITTDIGRARNVIEWGDDDAQEHVDLRQLADGSLVAIPMGNEIFVNPNAYPDTAVDSFPRVVRYKAHELVHIILHPWLERRAKGLSSRHRLALEEGVATDLSYWLQYVAHHPHATREAVYAVVKDSLLAQQDELRGGQLTRRELTEYYALPFTVAYLIREYGPVAGLDSLYAQKE